MKHARSVTRHLGVHNAREHVVIAIAENDPEIRRRAIRPDVHAAHVHKMPGLRI